jgi:hypothetical protein
LTTRPFHSRLQLAHNIHRSMGESVSALKNLQALRLHSDKSSDQAVAHLAKIKNLKHLSVEGGGSNENKAVQSILLNSTSTIRSLVVKTNPYATCFLKDWETKVSADDALANQKHNLAILKSFTLSGVSFDAAFIKSLQRAIDFMGLRELALGRLVDNKHLIFEHLTSLATSARNNAKGISLRSLYLNMSSNYYGETPAQTQTNFEATCRFISEFHTLTTLEIKDYNQYSPSILTNPGLSNMLLQAILRHKNLRCLKLTYIGVSSSYKIPYLSARSVAAIIDNLPQLEEFRFAPDEAEIVRKSLLVRHAKTFTEQTDTCR